MTRSIRPTQSARSRPCRLQLHRGSVPIRSHQANIDSVLPLLHLSANTEAEIVASVNVGLEVITHTDQVSVPGYIGEGYIIYRSRSRGVGLTRLGVGIMAHFYLLF